MKILLQRILQLEHDLARSRARETYWRNRANGRVGLRSPRKVQRPQRPGSRARGTCIGCGAPFDEQTLGCRSCTYRHSKRRLVA